MKFDTKVAEIQTNVTFNKAVKMTVDTDSISHIIRTLTDMYTDPYMAIAREYISNAYDACVDAMGSKSGFGVVLDQPIKVTLPSRLNPTFIVQDFGTGMSRDILTNVFPKYGASTKRTSDAEIGGYGLGAKSAFAAATNFIVTSIHEGKKNVAIFQKGEDGVGEANMLDEQDTTEDNGTVISITLPDPDRLARLFRDSNLLLGFPQSSISIDGVLNNNSVYNKELFTKISEDGWVATGLIDWEKSRHRMNRNYNQKTVLVGPIAYTFTKDQLGNFNYGYDLLDNYSVVNLPIGSVDLTPSRDSLVFTDKTRKAIVEATKRLNSSTMLHMKNMVASSESHSSAIRLVDSISQAGFNNLEWKYKGRDVPGMVFVPVKDKKHWHTVNGHKGRPRGFEYSIRGHNSIVVHSVKDSEHAIQLNRFRKAFEDQHPGLPDGFELIFTEAPKDELDFWTQHIVMNIYSPDEFTAQGTIYRKIINESRRAVRAANNSGAAPVNYGAVPVSILKPSNVTRDRPESTSVYVAYVAQEKNVVYIYSNDNTENVISRKFADNTSNKSGEQSVYEDLNRAFRMLAKHFDNEVTVVRIPANTRLETFLTHVPHALSMDVALKEAAKSYIVKSDFSTEVVAISRKFPNGDIEWTRCVAHSLDEIKNENVREWVRNAGILANLGYNKRTELRNFLAVLDSGTFSEFFQEINQEINAVQHYPLPLLERASRVPAAEALEYVNFKFSD